MDETLTRIVYERLREDGALEHEWAVYVIAACEGEEELDEVLGGSTRPALTEIEAPEPSEPRRAYIDSVTVTGFRGIGATQSLKLRVGPGLTLVVGRNGTGKSSFAEAFEFLLTGDNRRWTTRSRIWKEGWRNLHRPTDTRIEADLLLEGEKGPTTVRCTWEPGAALDDHSLGVQPPGKPLTDLSYLGWRDATDMHRPFLSYNELGAMFDEGPTALYDRLSAILGLEDLVLTEKLLREARLARDRSSREVRAELALLLTELQAADDERARRCTSLLSAKGTTWDLAAVEEIVHGAPQDGDQGEIDDLRQLAGLQPPSLDDVGTVVGNLRDARARLTRRAASPAAEARQVAGLLQGALDFHSGHRDADCPVCNSPSALTTAWADSARAELARLGALAAEIDAAHRTHDAALAGAHDLMRPPPSVLDRAAGVGLDSGVVRDLWTSFSTVPEDEGALADRLEEAVFPLNDAAEVLRREATTELQRREDAWRPRARRLGEWLPRARRSQEETNVVPGLRAAQDWLGGTAGAIRDERFAPIAEQATGIWRMLRQQSSVELGAIRLEGKGTQRRVSLDVSIDGVDGAALGVMSQGELHSMALSLFLPRAMLHESPFRFIFIDDPVQSMDPARVDGLAEVLASAATTHQIVVFTHDDRLPEATRRLGFAATIIAVARREGSVVELREELDPAKRHLKDAFDLAKTGDMPPKVAMRVVPGFCRAAIEAACFEVVRRRRIGVGSPHAEVENALVAVTKLTTALALALFDDASRGGDVLPRINSSFGKRAGDVFVACNRGAHQGYSGRLLDLARDSEYLVERIRSLK